MCDCAVVYYVGKSRFADKRGLTQLVITGQSQMKFEILLLDIKQNAWHSAAITGLFCSSSGIGRLLHEQASDQA